jgi:hypothetical protein
VVTEVDRARVVGGYAVVALTVGTVLHYRRDTN